MDIKNNKGITLMAELMTIVLLVLLVSVITYSSISSLHVKDLNNMYTDIISIQEKAENYYLKNEKAPIDLSANVSTEDFVSYMIAAEQNNVNDDPNRYYKIDYSALSNLTLNNKQTDSSFYYINEKTLSVYYTDGVEIESTTDEDSYDTFYTIPQNYSSRIAMDANVYIDNSEFNYDKGVNSPRLSKGMIPIKYNLTSGNWVVCSEDDDDWYNYIGTTTSDFKWANIMLSDGKYQAGNVSVGTEIAEADLGSMFVWIPRYAYSINEYKTPKDGEGTIQGITDVTFLVSTSNKDVNGNTYSFDYDEDSVEEGSATPKIVHPGFKFGDSDLERNMGSKI